MTFIYNPWRREHRGRKDRLRATLLLPLVRVGLACGFRHIDYAWIHGPKERLILGQGCSIMNTTFNTIAGRITIGDNALLSHDCMILTGTHLFEGGERVGLGTGSLTDEVPTEGRDISIGHGCFIGAGAIILGGVRIGANCIVGAGSVVTNDIPSGSFVAGVPATPR
jgi:acetyltransferase-like isoleucine patch superfamily enzyme